jgi:hypothetical protein
VATTARDRTKDWVASAQPEDRTEAQLEDQHNLAFSQTQLEMVVDTPTRAYNTTCPGFMLQAASGPHSNTTLAGLAPDVEEEAVDTAGIIVPAMPLHAIMAKAMATTISKEKVTAAARKVGVQSIYPSGSPPGEKHASS